MNFFFGIFFILKTCKKKMFPSPNWKSLVFNFFAFAVNNKN